MSAQFESMVKRMQHGFASRDGLTAAALAASGYVGIKRVFEREYGGWLSTFGDGHPTYPEQIYAGLGTSGRPNASRSSPTRPWGSCTPPSTPPSSYAPQ